MKAEDTERFNPIQGIIIYKRDNSFYLETHDILESQGKFHWQEGKPFVKQDLKELAVALGQKSFEPLAINGLLPENVLFLKQSYFNTSIVWYQPPMKRKLYFSKQLKLQNENYNLPGLIFIAHQKELYVFAFKGKSKPTAQTKVYKAPLYNIYKDGQVCIGNTKEALKKTELYAEIARHDKRFFNSRFDHFLDEEVIKKGVNLHLTLKSVCNNTKSFPQDLLVPTKHKTLNDLIKSVIKND